MNYFGEYRLSFTPSDVISGPPEPKIEMSISGEASVSELVSLFESFMKAAGYQIDGLKVVTEDGGPVSSSLAGDFVSFDDFWKSSCYTDDIIKF